MATVKLTNQRRGNVDVNSNKIINVSSADLTVRTDAVNVGNLVDRVPVQIPSNAEFTDTQVVVAGTTNVITSINGGTYSSGELTLPIGGTGIGTNQSARVIPIAGGIPRIESTLETFSFVANSIAFNTVGSGGTATGRIFFITSAAQTGLNIVPGVELEDAQITFTFQSQGTRTSTWSLGNVTPVNAGADGFRIDVPAEQWNAFPIQTDSAGNESLAALRAAGTNMPDVGTPITLTTGTAQVAPSFFIDSPLSALGSVLNAGGVFTTTQIDSEVNISAPNFLGTATNAENVEIAPTDGTGLSALEIPFIDVNLSGTTAVDRGLLADAAFTYNPASHILNIGAPSNAGNLTVTGGTITATALAGEGTRILGVDTTGQLTVNNIPEAEVDQEEFDNLEHRVHVVEADLSPIVVTNDTISTTTTHERSGTFVFEQAAGFSGYRGTFSNDTLAIHKSSAFPAGVEALVSGNVLQGVGGDEFSFVSRTELRPGQHDLVLRVHNSLARIEAQTEGTVGFAGRTYNNNQLFNIVGGLQLLVARSGQVTVPGATTLVESDHTGALARRNIATDLTTDTEAIPTVGVVNTVTDSLDTRVDALENAPSESHYAKYNGVLNDLSAGSAGTTLVDGNGDALVPPTGYVHNDRATIVSEDGDTAIYVGINVNSTDPDNTITTFVLLSVIVSDGANHGIWTVRPGGIPDELYKAGDGVALTTDNTNTLSVDLQDNGGLGFVSGELGIDNTPNNIGVAQTSEAFNVSYTIPQLTSIGLTYTPFNLDADITPFDLPGTVPVGQSFVLAQDTNTIADSTDGGAILNSYLTETTTVSTTDQATITAGTNGAGALLEFIVNGEIAGLFFTHDDTNNQWVMNNGFAPAPDGINIPAGTDYRLRYFPEAVPPFNNSGRVPFEGSDAELDAILLGYNGVASPVDGTRYLPLLANAELTSAYVDTNEIAVTTVVESITKRRDAFGPFLDLELNQSYRDQNGNRSNIYEPLIDTNARSISLQLVTKVLNSDLYTEGNATGTLNIDGKEVRVPGTLDGSERFETDLTGNVSFVQHNPLTGFQDGFRITYTDNTTNSGTKSSVVEIPGVQSNRDRIRALEGGGDAHSHTSDAFGSFPYPGSVSGTFAGGDLVGNADGFNFNTVNPVWSSLNTVTDAAQAHIDAGRTFSTGTASQTLAMPLSLRFIIGARTKVQGGSFPWLGTSIRPGEFNLRAGQNLITGDTSDPARELFLALENSFLWGYTADTATYRNSLSFAANDNVNAGAPGLTFGVTPTQRNPLTQFIGNGEYRQDVVVSFVGFNGVEEELNLGLTRVVHYTGPILAQDNTTTVNIPDTGAGASTRGEYLSHQAAASHYIITNGTVPKGISLGRLDAQMFWLYPIIQDPATRSSSQFTRRVVNYSGGAQTVGIENRYGNPNNPDIGNELRFYLPDDELNEIYGQDGRLTQIFQFPGIDRSDIQSGLGAGVNGFARDITLDFQSINPTDSTLVLDPVIGNNDFQFSDGGASLQSRLAGSGITITYIGTSDPIDANFGREFRVQVQTFDTGIPNFQFVARYNSADQRSGWIGINQNNPDSVLSVAYTPRFFVDGSSNAMGETRVSNLLRRDDDASTFIFDGATGDLLPIADYPTEAEYATSQVTVGTIDYGSGRETSYIDFRLPTVGAIPYVNGTNIGPQLGTSSVITELWQSNLGSNVNLHTLSGRRDTTTYPLSIDATWLYNQREADPNDLTLTTPENGSVLHYDDGTLSWDIDTVTRNSAAITEWSSTRAYAEGDKVYIEQIISGSVVSIEFYTALRGSINSNPTGAGLDDDWLPIGNSNSSTLVVADTFYEVNSIVRFPSTGDPGGAGANRYYRTVARDGVTITSPIDSDGIRVVLGTEASFEFLFEAGASSGDNNQSIRTILPITGSFAGTAGDIVIDVNNFGEDAKGTVPGPSAADIANNAFLRADGDWLVPLDQFSSPINNTVPPTTTTLTAAGSTNADNFTLEVNAGLRWVSGQGIGFSFQHGNAPARMASLGGTVDSYDATTGQITIRGPFQFLSDNSPVRLNNWSEVSFTNGDENIFQLGAAGPTGIQGDQGDQGIGIGPGVMDDFSSTLPGDPVTVMVERTDPANPGAVLSTIDFTVQPGAVGEKGDQGIRGFIGPFTVSLYAELAGVATNFAQADVITTYPIPTIVTFSSVRNELEGLNITDQPPGADAELNGDWSTQRPAVINNDIFVIEVVVTQTDDSGVDADDYSVGAFSGVFRAAAQGPAGPAGPNGPNGLAGRDPELNIKITQSSTAGITLINPSDPDGGVPDTGDFPLEFRNTLRITNSVNGDVGRDITGTVTLTSDFQGDNRILIQGNAVRTAGTDSTPTFWDVFVVAVQDTIEDVLDDGRSMQLVVAGIRGLQGIQGDTANTSGVKFVDTGMGVINIEAPDPQLLSLQDVNDIGNQNPIPLTAIEYTTIIIGYTPVERTTGAPTGFNASYLVYTVGAIEYFRLFATDGLSENLRTVLNDTSSVVHTKIY